METNTKMIMTVDELCESLDISQNIAYQLLKTGQIPCFKIGRVWKIPRQSVSDFIMKQAERNAVINLQGDPQWSINLEK